LLLVAATGVRADEARRIPVVGLLMSSVAPDDPVLQAFHRGLREEGYVEGMDVRVEYRGAYGDLDRLPGLAAELVALHADAIVVGNERTARLARDVSPSTPVVVSLYNYDPVAGGLIPSFAHPGNVTGVFTRTSELAGKRLEQLKEMLPNLARLAVFWDPLGQGEIDELVPAARAMRVELTMMQLSPPYDFDAAFRSARQQGVDAVLLISTPAFYVERMRIGEASRANGMAMSSAFRDATKAGGLISYGIEFPDAYHRLAHYVARILKGAKPDDLPFEQMRAFRLAVNARTAKALGLSTPNSILLRADDVFR
jgi:putative ABC transport system substrate-binding protein